MRVESLNLCFLSSSTAAHLTRDNVVQERLVLRHSACSISTGKEAAAAGVTTLHTAAHSTAGDTHEDTALTTLSALVCHCSSQWSPVSAAAPSTGATPLLSLAAAHSKHRLHILQALPAPTLTITGIHHQHIHCIHNRQSPAKNNEVSALSILL